MERDSVPSPALRLIIGLGALVLLLPLTPGCLTRWLGGAFEYQPSEMNRLSPGARQLVARAFADVGPEGLFDYHTHIVGIGTGNTGIEVNPNMRSWLHPLHRFKFSVYVTSSGITDMGRADQEYVERLLRLIDGFPKPTRHLIVGFERYHLPDGSASRERSEFHVPNNYVHGLAELHAKRFTMAASIHPYRADAFERLDFWAARGVRIVKWLPNAMGIHPADPRSRRFYQRMKKHNMILLVHAGEEKAVEAEEDQRLGNPLFLRAALQEGIRVVVAHCASLGQNPDFDKPGKPPADNFDLFMRLFQNVRYRGQLYGEISAMTQANRLSRPIVTLLRRPDLHSRLVNGSDYPLPAVNVVIRTRVLQSEGLITAQEREWLNEIYDVNPLLFDYVTKRTIRDPLNRKLGLSVQIFREHSELR